MSSTLYLLRQQENNISPSLFRANDADIDVIFLEEATSMAPSSLKNVAVAGNRIEAKNSGSVLTYDDLVEKIFSSVHVIVL